MRASLLRNHTFATSGLAITAIIIATYLSCDSQILGNRQIEFYGIVLDDSGNPMSDVKVSAQIERGTFDLPILWSTSPGKFRTITTQTDASGHFSIVKECGLNILIRTSKSGYEGYWPDDPTWHFPRSRELPHDKLHPDILKMRINKQYQRR